jgi:hypothetical protein
MTKSKVRTLTFHANMCATALQITTKCLTRTWGRFKKNLNAVVSKLIVLKFANDVTLDDTKKRRYISSPSFTQ